MISLILVAVLFFVAESCSISDRSKSDRKGQPWCEHGDSYLYSYSSGENSFSDLESAQDACSDNSNCGGITQEPYNDDRYTLRVGPELKEGVSPSDETSWTVCEVAQPQWCEYADSYLGSYSSGTNAFSDLQSAQDACLGNNNCSGITQEPYNGNRYTLRVGPRLREGASPSVRFLG